MLHLVYSISPLCGGPTYAVLGTCRELIARGIAATVATTNAHMPDSVPRGRPVDYEGIPVYFFSHQTPAKYAFSWGMTRWLEQNTRRFDVVHAHSVFSHCSTVAAHYARKYGVPYVISPEGTLDAVPLQKSAWRKRVYLRLIERRYLDFAAALDFKTEAERREAVALGLRAPTVVNSIGIAPIERADSRAVAAFREERQLDGRFAVLHLSRLDPIKGLELSLHAIGWLKREHVPVRLLIAGSGDPEYVAQLRRHINALGLDSEVTWLGMVQGSEKAAVFAAADAFVLASAHENFGVSTAEALYCGLPVAVTPQVGISDLVRKYRAGLIPDRNSAAIASALLTLWRDPALRREMGVNGQRLAREEFDPGRTTDRLVALYQSLCDGAGQGATDRNGAKVAVAARVHAPAPSAAENAVELHTTLARGWDAKYAQRPAFADRMRALHLCLGGQDLEARLWLDAGCGAGTLSRWLADRGCIVEAVDASDAMISEAARLNAHHARQDALRPPRHALLENLPFAAGSFDGVLCSSVLEYVECPERCLCELRRVLRAGGTLVVSVPNRESLVRRGLRCAHVITSLAGHPWPEYLGKSRHSYTGEEFAALLREQGFEVTRVQGCGSSLPGLRKTASGCSLLMFAALRQA